MEYWNENYFFFFFFKFVEESCAFVKLDLIFVARISINREIFSRARMRNIFKRKLNYCLFFIQVFLFCFFFFVKTFFFLLFNQLFQYFQFWNIENMKIEKDLCYVTSYISKKNSIIKIFLRFISINYNFILIYNYLLLKNWSSNLKILISYIHNIPFSR